MPSIQILFLADCYGGQLKLDDAGGPRGHGGASEKYAQNFNWEN
jgi:hypothetical protein